MRDVAPVPVGAPESMRNRVLRRADWRFLLPDPAPERALSFAHGALHEAVSAVAGVVHHDNGASDAGFDVVVASNPDPATTRRALAVLRDGGAFYSEWTGVRAVNATAVRRALARGGARAARLYWPWPWPTIRPTRYWLPLDSAAASALLRSAAAPARQPILRTGGRWLNACERLMLGSGIRYPLVAIIIKGRHDGQATDTTSPPLPRELATAIATSGCASGTDELTWLLLTPGPRAISKVVGLVLPRDNGPPVCAVKMARVTESEPGLAREADALTAIRELTPAAATAAPELLFSVRTRAGLAIGEYARTGRPLWRNLDRFNHPTIARRVTVWLTGLVHRQPASRDWQVRYIDGVIDEFTRTFGDVVDRNLLGRTREMLRALPPLPATLEHRDAGPWNILVEADDGFAVLDWESAERDGVPALDLLYFLTYLAFFAEDAMQNGRTLSVFRASLDPTTRIGRIRAECLDVYARRVGLAQDALPALRLLVWMIHCRSAYRHLAEDLAGQPPVHALRDSLFLRLWTEEAHSVVAGADVHLAGVQEGRP